MDKFNLLIIVFILIAASGTVFGLWLLMRKRFIDFTTDISASIEQLLLGNALEDELEEETLNSKIKFQLKRLAEITVSEKKKNIQQKIQMQEMISDISHQLKTPIANITMYNDTMLNHDLPKEKQVQCLEVMHGQVRKLDFLIQSMMKMSRLESNLITLKKEWGNLYETITEAMSAIALKAEEKKLLLTIHCENPYTLFYDQKWTQEAIFNVLDNAVKYTQEGGEVSVIVDKLEIYTKISVKDTGIGISSEHTNDIFKRFFRESKVHRQEGVGLGLYITREIVTQQGGYMKVQSSEGEGSNFSLYFSNDSLI